MGIKDWFFKQKLEKILYSIGKDFNYMTDNERFNRRDYWAKKTERWLDGKLVDDCDGFALEAHERCTEAGFKARLVECRKMKDDGTVMGHLICEVQGWILHNGGLNRGAWWCISKEEFEKDGWWYVKISDYTLTETHACWYEVK